MTLEQLRLLKEKADLAWKRVAAKQHESAAALQDWKEASLIYAQAVSKYNFPGESTSGDNKKKG